jgi:hypothetical protein
MRTHAIFSGRSTLYWASGYVLLPLLLAECEKEYKRNSYIFALVDAFLFDALPIAKTVFSNPN